MPSIRIGFSTDFNLTGEQIGIGTTNPTARLDVAGQIRSDDSAGSGGVSTVTRYAGFLDEAQGLGNNVSIAETTKGNLNSLSGEIKISGEVTVTEDTKLTGGRLDSLTVTGKFDLPHGGSEDREDTPEKGSTRFNQDLGQLEFYTGYEWRTVNSYADSGGRGRGVFAGTGPSPITQEIDYVNITTTGNTTNFGRLSSLGGAFIRGCSSSIRGVYGLGSPFPSAPTKSFMEYITIASEGNAINFGNLTSDSSFAGGMLSSTTRGVIHESANPTASSNVISYIEIPTLGNALDFGDMNTGIRHLSGFSSPTRGIFTGGYVNPSSIANINFNQYVTIASKGNALVFGDMTKRLRGAAGFSNSVRGCYGGGVDSPTNTIQNSIDYVTIATTGNAVDFGDLTAARRTEGGGCSSQIRGIFAGGYGPTNVNTIDYITIASQGNAIDFGDRSTLGGTGACSDSHGGLGGF